MPADAETPEWVSLATSEPSQDTKEDGKDEKSPKAAPKTWRGVGEFEVCPFILQYSPHHPSIQTLECCTLYPGFEAGITYDSVLTLNFCMLQEDWGELYTGKQAPGIFILDLKTFMVQPLAGTPENSSVGQPVWSPTGNTICT